MEEGVTMRLLVSLLLTGMSLFAQEPVDYRGWLNQGVSLFKSARYAEATQAFERAVSLDPAQTVPHLYLGTAYMQQYVPGANSPENDANAQRAEEQFRRVLDIEPQNKTALASVASLNLNRKNFDEALLWYGKLIAADPSNADAYYTLGFVAWSKWYPEYAKARKNAGLTPEAPGPLPDPAMRHALNSQYGPMLQAGIDALNKALEINPDYSDAMAYMNLLIRERADLRDSAVEWRQDVAEADQWVQKALAAKKAKAERSTAASLAATGEPKRIRISSNIQEAKLITLVPPAAASVQGDVVLSAVIDGAGNVKELSVLKGHPMLIPAAINAVKQWKYRPTLLNGEPVEVATEITIKFP
jgi:TonB family protein